MNMRHIAGIAAAAAVLALSGCAGGSGSGGAPLPTVVLGQGGATTAIPATTLSATTTAAPRSASGVVASAVIAPADQAVLVSGISGRIAAVTAADGATVPAGQLLLAFDDQSAQAQLAQAQANLAAAQANYDVLAAGATDAALRQTQALVDAAQATLNSLEAGPRAEQVAQAEANLASAQAALARLQSGPTDLELQAAQLVIDEAKDARWAAQSTRDATCGSALLAGSECDTAEAQVLVAEARVNQAENQLAQLKAGADPETIAQAEQAVRIAEAQLALAKEPATAYDLAKARAAVDGAQAALDALVAGAEPEQLAAAKAQVAQAETAVSAAQAALDGLTITAPFGGTVADLAVYAGQWVIPGQTLATVATLDSLVAETTDLSELDVPGVALGQAVTVNVEALGVDVPGVVQEIAPLASTLGGDVVYQVTVTLSERPDGLRAGMSAEVRF